MAREIISLNGLWDWYIPKGRKEKIKVPSSYLCVGEAIFERKFNLHLPNGKKAILRFDGIAYEGDVEVNGNHIGIILPFSRYEFDITEYLSQGENCIKVSIKDSTASYGPSEGWENYGGIIWGVYLEIRNSAYISDYQFITEISNDYKKAHCILNIWIKSTEESFKGVLETAILYDGTEYAKISKKVSINSGENTLSLEFDVFNPLLWSPDFPHLYDLKIKLEDYNESTIIDEVSQQVGFREFVKKGTKFYLNGQEFILKGVCRHHMWGEQGYTLSIEQMEKDMKMIKDMGANYVRLVHYPHPKEIIELSDRLGLMVSEEPGLWWSNLSDPVITDSALKVLERTIIRDRNNPSVIFWLIFNECIFVEDYIKKAKELCNKLDPTRMVSAANVMNPEWTKDVFTKEDLDFYTYHPYGYTPGDSYGYDNHAVIIGGYGSQSPWTSLEKILGLFNDKPVVFTEWGGGRTFNNPTIVKNFWRAMSSFFYTNSPEGNLAGTSYWCWNDYFEYSRWLPGNIEGISTSGLVDIWRNKRTNYYVLSELFSQTKYDLQKNPSLDFPNFYLPSECNKYELIDLSYLSNSQEQKNAWKLLLEKAISEDKRRGEKISPIGPIIPEEIQYLSGIPVKIDEGSPVVISNDIKRITIPIGQKCSELYIFGHTTFPSGYPVKGSLGEEIARYILSYTDGVEEEIILRNGLEFTTSKLIWKASRLNPIAANIYKVAKITIDPIWEVYIINCFIKNVDRSKILNKLTFELLNPMFIPLLYGITVGI